MSRRARPLDVAIVGMACRFPGARDIVAYWENIVAGRPAIRDVPPGRWDVATFYDPDSPESDRVGGRRGGYLDEPIDFDAASFGIMPRTVEGGEPEQFLVLDAARAALADAGLASGIEDGRRVEVVIGRGNYFNRGNLTGLQHGRVLAQTLGILRALHPEWIQSDLEAVRADFKAQLPPFEAATIPGQLTNATAGRLAYRFDLNGPAYVVDAASASSLVALDLGARALTARRADLVVVGGVYIEADVDFPMVFSRLGVLSRSGAARPFSRDADGMVPGEGVGIVVLKRLADAERDSDRVYAVVKGVGLASDGRGATLSAPDARGHLRAMRRAYRQAGVEPATVGLIEGHGLGVPAADRAELRALRAMFPRGRRRTLGAVSALIGHAMPAAGMAGLIKAALAVHHRVVPVSQGSESPHALASADGSVSLTPVSRPWIQGDVTPRRAGVNAFGFAGINAHAVIEEHVASADGETPGVQLDWPDEAILLGAPDRAGLVERMRSLAARLQQRPDGRLKDLAYTVSDDANQAVRLGLVVSSIGDLIARLEALGPKLADRSCRAIRDARGAYFWERPLGREGGLAFLFPGEGSQYPGMLADLCRHFPEVRALFDTSDRLALESGAIEPPSERLFGAADDPDLWQSGTAVNVVLSSQWALYQLLRKLGLRPDAVAGHSSGEFLALAASGAVRVDRRLEERFNELAALFANMEASDAVPSARLASIAADRDRVEAAIGGGAVSIAIDNCPHQVVVAGPDRAVETVVARLRAEGVVCDDLPFSRAYHAPDFAPALGPVRAFFEALEIGVPTTPLYSCSLARRLDPGTIRSAAIDQWTRRVEFRRTVETMHEEGLRVFVDVGARGNLAGFVEDTLRGRTAFAVAANLPRRPGLTQLNHLVASLFAQGVELSPRFLFARRRPERIDLDAAPPARRATVAIALGFPEMKLGAGLAARLAQPPSPEHRPERPRDEASILSYLQGMRGHLETQRQVMAHYLAKSPQSANAGRANSHLPGRPSSLIPKALPVNGTQHKNGKPSNGLARHVSHAGEWAGEVQSLIKGHEVEACIRLEAKGDPVAQHHTFGGRRISAVDPSQKGLPVLPFTVMAEMLAQVAARLQPGARLVGLRDVRARRWIRYEEAPIALDVRAEVLADRPGEVRAVLFNRGSIDAPREAEESPDVEGIAVFAPTRPEPSPASHFDLEAPEASRFTAASMYAEQWLFHGPALRAVVGVGGVSDRGIEGTLRILPRRDLSRDRDGPPPLTDPIVLDAFTHLLGVWGLDRLAEGDVIFPLRMGRLDIFGDDPPEGTDVTCRIAVRDVERYRVRVEAEIVRPDGGVWMRIGKWEDWRFYWPPRYRDVFRLPDRILLGEPIPLPGHENAMAVWLQPPADMGRPVWRDVLEQIQLSPEERHGCVRPTGHEGRRTLRLWGRIAAKEAARRLWLAEGGAPVYPADLSILPDAHGRPILQSRLEPARADLPAVSIAHTVGVALALAVRDPFARVGIDVERITTRGDSFEELAFSASERIFLEGTDRAATVARLWCAKEAAAKATGRGLVKGPASVEVVEFDRATGATCVSLSPELGGGTLRVATAVRGEYAWAWTISEAAR